MAAWARGMTTLPVFLLARLDEDKAVAKAVPASPWGDDFSVRFESWESDHSDEDSAFVDRFDPARVLADVEAKRRIVEEHEMMPARKITVGVLRFNDGREVSPYYRDGCCQTCTAWGEYGGPADAETGALNYCPTLRLLALPYADHPDYRAEWKP